MKCNIVTKFQIRPEDGKVSVALLLTAQNPKIQPSGVSLNSVVSMEILFSHLFFPHFPLPSYGHV